VQQRLKLKQAQIDTWSLKEQLYLASAVLKNGDQNWVSVSRTMKQLGEPVGARGGQGRPTDWFKDKNCALQYNLLLEKADIPIRKRGEKGEAGQESPAQSIVNKLAQERMLELERVLEEERREILRLEEETELLSSDDVTPAQLATILASVEAEEAAEEEKERQQQEWLEAREAKKLAIQRALKNNSLGGPGQVLPGVGGASTTSLSEQSLSGSEHERESPGPPQQVSSSFSAPLLTSILLSPSGSNSSPNQSPVKIQPPQESSFVTGALSKLRPELSELSKVPSSKIEEPINKDHEKLKEISHHKSPISSVVEEINNMVSSIPETDDHPIEITSEEVAAFDQVIELDKDTLSDLDELLKKELQESSHKTDKNDPIDDIVIQNIIDDVPIGEPCTEAPEIGKNESVVSSADVEKPVGDESTIEASEVPEEKPDLKKNPTKNKTRKEDFLLTLEPVKNEMKMVDEEEEIKKEMESIKDEELEEKVGLEDEKCLSEVEEEPESPGVEECEIIQYPEEEKEVTEEVVEEETVIDEEPMSSPFKDDDVNDAEEVGMESEPDSPATTEPEEEDVPPLPSPALEEDERNVEESEEELKEAKEEKEYKSWKRSIILVWNQIAQHKNAWIFASPVTESGYKDIVYRPMDLGTIKKNVESGAIRNTVEFQRDLSLMFFNAIMYNSSDHEVYSLTRNMQEDASKIVREYLNTQALLKSKGLDVDEYGGVGVNLQGLSPGRVRAVSASSATTATEAAEKRKRTHSVAEESNAKKRRLRNVDEN